MLHCVHPTVPPPNPPGMGKRGRGGGGFQGGCSFYIKKIKSQIFNDKKSLPTKMFFFVTTKNLEILTKNLVTFKRWDEIKAEKF